jgi:hypothetical protein
MPGPLPPSWGYVIGLIVGNALVFSAASDEAVDKEKATTVINFILVFRINRFLSDISSAADTAPVMGFIHK